jgi:hypothetical protein
MDAEGKRGGAIRCVAESNWKIAFDPDKGTRDKREEKFDMNVCFCVVQRMCGPHASKLRSLAVRKAL